MQQINIRSSIRTRFNVKIAPPPYFNSRMNNIKVVLKKQERLIYISCALSHIVLDENNLHTIGKKFRTEY